MDCHGVVAQEILTLTEVRIGPKSDHLTAYRVLRIQPYKGLLILELEGFTHQVALSSLGQTVWVDRAQLPPLEEGEYYWEDLVGLRLVTEGGEEEGTVEAVMATGSNEVLVCSCREREILVPFIDDVVVRVDLDQGVVVIRALDQWM